FGSEYLLITCAGLFVVGAAVASLARGNSAPSRGERPAAASGAGPRARLNPYLVSIAALIGVTAVATTIVDYLFKIVAAEAYPEEAQLAAFFGAFYAVTGVAGLFIQLFATGRVIQRFGILGGLLLLPISLSVGSLAALLRPVLLSVILAKGSEQIVKQTTHQASLQLLWVPIDTAQKRASKPFVDGPVKMVAEGAAGVLIFLVAPLGGLRWLSAIALALVGVWLFVSVRARAGYIASLATGPRLDLEDLELDVADPHVTDTVDRMLRSEAETQQITALELIEQVAPEPWAESLGALYRDGSALVQEKVLNVAGDSPAVIPNDELVATIERQDSFAAQATLLIGRRRAPGVAPMLRELLDHPEPAQQAAAAVALRGLRADDEGAAETRLRALLLSNDPVEREAALVAALHEPDFVPDEVLTASLGSASSEVRLAALRIVDASPKQSLLPAVVQTLGDPETRVAARRTLRAFADEDVLYDLNRAFRRPDASRDLRVGIVRAIRDGANAGSLRSMLDLLDRQDLTGDTESEAVDALLHLARATPLPTGADRRVLAHIRRLASRAYWGFAAETLVVGDEAACLLARDHYHQLARADVVTLLKLCVMTRPQTPVETIAYHVDTQGDGLADSLEVLDNVVPREARDLVMPLAEPRSLADRVAAGRALGLDLPDEAHQVVVPLLESPRAWLAIVGSACADDAALALVDWDSATISRADAGDLPGHVARYTELLTGAASPSDEQRMYSELEKTAYLKSTGYFRDIPGEEVFYIAQVAEEQHLADGESLFEDGDPGHSLYAVIEGEILLHKGGREVNRTPPLELLGEMGIINQAPRSLGAVAVGPTILLRISEEDFLHILETRADVMKGVMRQVMQRLDRLTNLYAEALSEG
ncbi:cyclic nucleotide-binding domain-containing protein, partial [Candidatus Poribacteria bacterium]|nr:cyclic nucleotide-binding domain-containing protein [Candidatus Poribacteria bacterium]